MITFEQWLKENNLTLPEAAAATKAGECAKCGDPLEDGKCPACDPGHFDPEGLKPGEKRRKVGGEYEKISMKKSKKK
jgi:hypothetical protein